jgi:hypothetical protein
MYGPSYIEHEYQLPFVISYILGAASKTVRLADFLEARQTDEVSSKVLMEAADKFGAMLEPPVGNIVGWIVKEKLGLPFEFQDDDAE